MAAREGKKGAKGSKAKTWSKMANQPNGKKDISDNAKANKVRPYVLCPFSFVLNFPRFFVAMDNIR